MNANLSYSFIAFFDHNNWSPVRLTLQCSYCNVLLQWALSNLYTVVPSTATNSQGNKYWRICSHCRLWVTTKKWAFVKHIMILSWSERRKSKTHGQHLHADHSKCNLPSTKTRRVEAEIQRYSSNFYLLYLSFDFEAQITVILYLRSKTGSVLPLMGFWSTPQSGHYKFSHTTIKVHMLCSSEMLGKRPLEGVKKEREQKRKNSPRC